MTDPEQGQPGEQPPDTDSPEAIAAGVGRTSATERDAITSDKFFSGSPLG
ncbi:MAG: hypothetical protein ACRDHZ_10490 [Ktedonobacteraceae bacterium]